MNKILIEGRLGKDAEIKETSGGKMLVMTVAETQFEGKEKNTIWYDVTSFNFNEKLVQYYKKGSLVFITGTLRPKEETGKDGTIHNRLRVSNAFIDFTSSSKSDTIETKTNETSTSAQETTTGSNVSMYASKNKKKEEAVPEPIVTTATSSEEDNSDLPF